MSTKLFLGIMVMVLAIAGYVAYEKFLAEHDMEPLTVDGISFICQDGSYFIAEFSPDFSRLNIVVDGVTERSVTRINTDNTLYEYRGEGYTYLFAGEEARVTRPEGSGTVCSQPLDPNNAPHNFGDQGEGAGSKQPDTALVVMESIQGIWQSIDDPKFARQFKDNGVVIDTYEGQADTEGVWNTFTTDTGAVAPFPLEPGVVYLQLEMGGGQEELLYFKVISLTPEELELAYMGRGNILRFTYIGPAH